MLITKADGSKEEFKPGKLRRSLKRSGAHSKEIDKIVAEIEAIAYDGMKTKDIYKHAFSLLAGTEAAVVARYALRRALFGLGPTGFPFEKFLARLYDAEGYKTKVGITLNGKCAVHEIDVAAYKDDHAFVAEAKFHSRPGLKSDLQVAMYSYARLLDLSDQKICNADICGVKNLRIITNTKFTSAAAKYAHCVGVEIIGWDYPKENNLYSLIEKTGLYPITVLRGLSGAQKKLLLQNNVIVCADLLNQKKLLNQLNISSSKLEALLSEARQLSEGK